MAKKPKVIYHWYKNIISDYQDDQKNGKFLGQKVYEYDKDSAEVTKELKVHIIKPDNMGSSMIIDEKMIGHKYSVIISNEQTGKTCVVI